LIAQKYNNMTHIQLSQASTVSNRHSFAPNILRVLEMSGIELATAAALQGPEVGVLLRRFLDGKFADEKDAIREFLAQPVCLRLSSMQCLIRLMLSSTLQSTWIRCRSRRNVNWSRSRP
jgi:hypothetical protein